MNLLTDDDIWKNDSIMAANSGYGANFETLRELARAIEAAVLEKMKQEQAEPVAWMHRSNNMHFIKEKPLGEVGFLFVPLYAAPQGPTELLLHVQAFLNRVTHWQEGKPDLHDIKVAIKEALK